MYVIENIGNQVGYEALSPTSATGFTSSIINPTSGVYKGMSAKAVLLGVETNMIRFRMDGTDATADNGMPLPANNFYTIIGAENIKNFSCIDTAVGASSVKVLPFF
ncbi:hypothetical protein KAX02_03055 [candidate division WOR-3 bacterium]|nr:hypothetical protein [candidate division WOR-3 bacterium]